ncbi:MAG TPA: methyltransferase domain-containing protein [Candidatus Nanoarchaeia archaeon]|nr:methyltransferase domain-containing protein [Candidatus Nanoarchaeia archaeon]
MKLNAFREEIPEFARLLEDKVLTKYITRTLVDVLRRIRPIQGSTEPSPEFSAEDIVNDVRFGSEKLYEEATHIKLKWFGYIRNVQKARAGRAQTVYSQIAPHVQGTVLDIGCGDGQIGKRLADAGHEVVLADVYKNPNIDSTGLEFILFEQGEPVPDTRQYDTTLLLTVMHHSNDPIETLRDAKERTKRGGRIVIIESVYGIGSHIQEPSYGEPADSISKEFKALTAEQQRCATLFFDHFSNRVVQYSDEPSKKINVPYNFRKPLEWKEIFESMGLHQTYFVHLGMDQPVVPEYHTLHVLAK